jgi:hypothetical protein
VTKAAAFLTGYAAQLWDRQHMKLLAVEGFGWDNFVAWLGVLSGDRDMAWNARLGLRNLRQTGSFRDYLAKFWETKVHLPEEGFDAMGDKI